MREAPAGCCYRKSVASLLRRRARLYEERGRGRRRSVERVRAEARDCARWLPAYGKRHLSREPVARGHRDRVARTTTPVDCLLCGRDACAEIRGWRRHGDVVSLCNTVAPEG